MPINIIDIYNRLQTLRQEAGESYANLRACLNTREQITAQLLSDAAPHASSEHLHNMRAALRQGNIVQLRALLQAVPELHTSASHQQLMRQLDAAEHDLRHRQEGYNNRARQYNACRSTFPTIVLAWVLFFAPAPYFQSDETVFAAKASKCFKS